MTFAFTAVIQKFAAKGEKTGWTYVLIPTDIITKLKLKDKKGFRIKGLIDDIKIEKLSTYPIGQGEFIIAINAELRKKLGKKEGALVKVNFARDVSKPLQSEELMKCLKNDEVAMKQFKSLLLSHQNYFHRYVETAKMSDTKAGRIVHVINAMYKKQDFGQMIRSLKAKNQSQ
jgi:hypothetical protein